MKYDTPRLRAKAAGLKRYEGLPCNKCGGTTRLVSNQQCIPCRQDQKYAARKKKQKYDKRGRPPKDKVELTPKDKVELTPEEKEIKRKAKRAYEKEYWKRPENLGRKRAKKAKRRCAEIQQKPQWLSKDDIWLIKEIYDLAIARTELLGFKWEVDHIIPLRAKEASGLHTPNNLQVIPMTENRKKQNKIIP